MRHVIFPFLHVSAYLFANWPRKHRKCPLNIDHEPSWCPSWRNFTTRRGGWAFWWNFDRYCEEIWEEKMIVSIRKLFSHINQGKQGQPRSCGQGRKIAGFWKIAICRKGMESCILLSCEEYMAISSGSYEVNEDGLQESSSWQQYPTIIGLDRSKSLIFSGFTSCLKFQIFYIPFSSKFSQIIRSEAPLHSNCAQTSDFFSKNAS